METEDLTAKSARSIVESVRDADRLWRADIDELLANGATHDELKETLLANFESLPTDLCEAIREAPVQWVLKPDAELVERVARQFHEAVARDLAAIHDMYSEAPPEPRRERLMAFRRQERFLARLEQRRRRSGA